MTKRSLLLLVSMTMLIAAGCSSDDEDKAPVAEREVPKQQAPVEKPPEPPDPAEIWAELVGQARQQLEDGEFEEVEKSLDKLAKVYTEPEVPSEEQQAERTALETELVEKRAAAADAVRVEKLAAADEALNSGDYTEAVRLATEVLALAPSTEQRKQAQNISSRIEDRRKARRLLGTWLQLLESSDSGSVRTAQRELAREADTSLPLLLEIVKSKDNPVLISNTLDLLRRLRRPESTLPAMLGVLQRPGQKENWADAADQIVYLKHPGAGQALLDLALSSEDPQQRAIAFRAVSRVIDPPQETLIALLPIIHQDGPELTTALKAAYHAVSVHGQYDLIARRGLDTDLTPEQQDLLKRLPERLDQLMQAEDESAAETAQAATVLAMATGQAVPQVFEGVQVASAAAELETSPAAGAVDGQWTTVEPETMWRYPVGQRSSLVLDLGEVRTVTAVRLWNLNEPNGTHRGWKELAVLAGETETSLEPASQGVLPPAPGAAETPDFSALVPVPFVRARYVKVEAKSVWRPDGHTGLSEVQVLGF